jgi:predicted methyltransferase
MMNAPARFARQLGFLSVPLFALLIIAAWSATLRPAAAQQPTPAPQPAPAPAPTPKKAPAPGEEMGHIDRSILDDPGRPAEEKAQDPGRKALEVYEWLGVKPGMVVADVFPSGGYNTFLLSKVVGPKGKVYSVLEFYANKELFDGKLYKVDVLKERVAKNNLTNVELVTHIADLKPNSVEAMIAVRNYHDVEWVFPGLTRKECVAAMFNALKPGGVVAIEEVATDKPGWDKETHRLNEKVVLDDFTSGGFELAEKSNLLANPADDHSTPGFKEGRQNMDQYLLKFRKPLGHS